MTVKALKCRQLPNCQLNQILWMFALLLPLCLFLVSWKKRHPQQQGGHRASSVIIPGWCVKLPYMNPPTSLLSVSSLVKTSVALLLKVFSPSLRQMIAKFMSIWRETLDWPVWFRHPEIVGRERSFPAWLPWESFCWRYQLWPSACTAEVIHSCEIQVNYPWSPFSWQNLFQNLNRRLRNFYNSTTFINTFHSRGVLQYQLWLDSSKMRTGLICVCRLLHF